jgi:hypothetical protein
MNEIINIFDNVIEVLQRTQMNKTKSKDSVLVNNGTSCVLYAISKDNTVYKCQASKDENREVRGSVFIYKDLDIDRDHINDLEKYLSKEPDEQFNLSKEGDNITVENSQIEFTIKEAL